MLRRLLVSAAALTLAGRLHGQVPRPVPDTATVRQARALLVAMHAEEALLAGVDSALAAQRRSGDQSVPPVYFDSLTARIRREAPSLLDSLAVVYARALPLADLRELTTFYQGPLGHRFAEAQVGFQAESAEIAQRWGMRLSFGVMQELIEKGLIKPPQ